MRRRKIPGFRAVVPTNVYRKRIPSDLSGLATGRMFPLDLPAFRTAKAKRVLCRFTPSEVKVHLESDDPVVIEVRAHAIEAHVQRIFADLRAGPSKRDFIELAAMSEPVYWLYVDTYRRTPGDPLDWAAEKAISRAIREGRINEAPAIEPGFLRNREFAERLFGDDLTTGVNALPRGSITDIGLESRFGLLADWAMAKAGVGTLMPDDRRSLLKLCDRAADLAAWCLKRNAIGDFSDDPAALSFPKVEVARPTPKRSSDGPSLLTFLDGWKAEAKPPESTYRGYRHNVRMFVDFMGHDRARDMTPHDVVRWKDKLVADGFSPKGINDSKLVAVKRAFRWGLDNHHITSNPAQGVAVSHRARAADGMQGYGDREAAIILREALASGRTSVRWIPLLCAATGARVSEMSQLRAEDVIEVEGSPALRLTWEAGGLKTDGSMRTLPLHRIVIEHGFLAFAQQNEGHLFYGPRRRADAVVESRKIVAGNVAQFIRDVARDHELRIGRIEHRVDPNHGWRHRLASLMREASIEEEVREAYCGRSPNSVGRHYGHMPYSRLKTAIDTVPSERIMPQS